MKMERLTDDNIVYYEVVKIVLIHKTSIPPPRKGFFKNKNPSPYRNSNLTSYIVWFLKMSTPITRMVTGNSEGEGGSQKSNF